VNPAPAEILTRAPLKVKVGSVKAILEAGAPSIKLAIPAVSKVRLLFTVNVPPFIPSPGANMPPVSIVTSELLDPVPDSVAPADTQIDPSESSNTPFKRTSPVVAVKLGAVLVPLSIIFPVLLFFVITVLDAPVILLLTTMLPLSVVSNVTPVPSAHAIFPVPIVSVFAVVFFIPDDDKLTVNPRVNVAFAPVYERVPVKVVESKINALVALPKLLAPPETTMLLTLKVPRVIVVVPV
jgi:hypothetical protein